MTKKCIKCSKEYLATREYFYTDKRTKDGFYSWCKKCHCALSENWREKNPGYYKEYNKKYHKKYCKTLEGYIIRLMNHIKFRCTNKKYHSYSLYGGRGIKCTFTVEDLYNWLVDKNINPCGLQIHRINNDGNYALDNIGFLDKSTHMRLHHLQNRKKG